MKISVITAVFNCRDFIEDCILSVSSQTNRDIEHIIIDGGSTDGTVDLIKKHSSSITVWTTGPDNGIYEALNKGLATASGDVVGFLHADDIYAGDDVLATVAAYMTESGKDSCHGDLLYVGKRDTNKVIRYWKSRPYEPGMFERGWMPPHPAFFAKKEVFERFGYFNTGFRISADYELMLRFLRKENIAGGYIPKVFVKMRVGGASNRSIKNLAIKTLEDYRAWKINGLSRRFYTIPLKNLSKIPQFIRR